MGGELTYGDMSPEKPIENGRAEVVPASGTLAERNAWRMAA